MTDLEQKTVHRAIAPLLAEARIASPLTSQLLAGEVVSVMEARNDWRLVRGGDGYVGWTHAGYLMPSVGDESTWRISLGCDARNARGERIALPLGARITPGDTVVCGDMIAAEDREARFRRNAFAIAQSACSLYEGASYLWGGVTPWGCDCSGFVQRIFGLHDVSLPRDAWQQALLGQALSDDASADHEPGTLIFFSDREDRRITHVGMALGAHRMVHSALMRGGVAVEMMLSEDPYVARLRAQCVSARRLVS